MSPESLRIDRTFRGVGRIARTIGSTKPAMRRKISRMLDALHDDGRLEILRALRDGGLDFLAVYEAYQTRGLDRLPLGRTAEPIATAMARWIESLLVPRDASAKHVESLETSRRYFERHNPDACVADLPAILEELRTTLGNPHPRSFNLCRAAALAFVRATLKKTHPLWLAISAVEPRAVETSEPHRPLSPTQMRNFFPAPATDPLDAIAWSMATTGMHQQEYWGRWETLSDRIHIDGTKRRGRKRDVPHVWTPVRPAMHRRTFEDKLRERTRAFLARDLRRTYAHWLELAGVPRTRRRLYLGHGAGDVTGLYELHEVTAFLAEDTTRLRAFLGLIPTKSHTIGRRGRRRA